MVIVKKRALDDREEEGASYIALVITILIVDLCLLMRALSQGSDVDLRLCRAL